MKYTFDGTGGARYTLEAIWAGMQVNNLKVPYDGAEHSIKAEKKIEAGTLFKTERYKTEIMKLLSDDKFYLTDTKIQLIDIDGVPVNQEPVATDTFTQTEPGVYHVKVTTKAYVNGEYVNLEKDAYLTIYPAQVIVHKIWIDWYDSTGIRQDKQRDNAFESYLKRSESGKDEKQAIRITASQAYRMTEGQGSDPDPDWIDAADHPEEWIRTYDDVLVRPDGFGTDLEEGFYNYYADETVPAGYTKLSVERTVSADRLSTDIKIINQIKRMPVTFIKNDEDNKALSGAEFEITMLKNAKGDKPPVYSGQSSDSNYTKVWNITIGSKQVDLFEGFYKIEEKVAPEGYSKIPTSYFTVKDGKVTFTDAEGKPVNSTAISVTNNTVENDSSKSSASVILRDGKGQQVALKKVGVNNTDQSKTQTNLGGAKFTIYSATGTNNDTKGSIIEVDGAKLENLTSDSTTGAFWSGTLPAGDYLIEETEAPAGYNMLSCMIKMTVAGDGVTLSYVGTTGDPSGLYNTPVKDGNTWTITIIDTAGVALPNTGGPGTRLFTIIGSILVCLAGALFIRRRRFI